MSDVVLVLGPITFRAFEIPAGINFGGRQLLAVHQLTDGRRVVDSIGADESTISFSGAFSGADATLRARALNYLRVAGDELSLTWDVFYYAVVLSRFDADYQNPVWIPYRISCTVVQDEAVASAPTIISLSNSISSDLDAAAAQCSGLDLDFTDAQDALTNPDATTLGSAAYAATQYSIGGVQSAINAQISVSEAALQTAATSNLTTATALVNALLQSAIAAQQLADLTSANAYIGRAALNLSNAST
jgi:hypothetical protein